MCIMILGLDTVAISIGESLVDAIGLAPDTQLGIPDLSTSLAPSPTRQEESDHANKDMYLVVADDDASTSSASDCELAGDEDDDSQQEETFIFQVGVMLVLC